MTAIEELIAPLRSSPFLPEICSELGAILAAEEQRRMKFYEEMTPEMKVEFIEGQVILHSPARNRHLDVTNNIATLLSIFVKTRELGQIKVEKCLCCFPRNDYEPDIVFFGKEKAATLTDDTMRFPVPDFVVEILSESTAANDRGVKFDDYQAHGVQEYWIVDADLGIVEQYLLEDGKYQLCTKSGNGNLRSRVIEGFDVDIAAFFDAKANAQAIRTL